MLHISSKAVYNVHFVPAGLSAGRRNAGFALSAMWKRRRAASHATQTRASTRACEPRTSGTSPGRNSSENRVTDCKTAAKCCTHVVKAQRQTIISLEGSCTYVLYIYSYIYSLNYCRRGRASTSLSCHQSTNRKNPHAVTSWSGWSVWDLPNQL